MKVQKGCIIYKRINEESSNKMEQLHIRNVDQHNRSNRYSKLNLVCPRYKRETEKRRTFKVTGSKLWNSFPVEVRNKDSLHSFKYALKRVF